VYAEVLFVLLLSWTQVDPKEPKLPQRSRSVYYQPVASVLTTILNLFVFSLTTMGNNLLRIKLNTNNDNVRTCLAELQDAGDASAREK